jgi:peptidoglycan/xylan/chitin deacetylase (PgdA/CDA1 family)
VVRLVSLALAMLLLLGSAIGATAAEPTIRLIYRGAQDQPVVALTFDDGYSPSNCAKILDILERRHVAATFFPYAWAVGTAPAFWRRVAAAGYPIANHTTSHPNMTSLSLAEARSEITRARRAIEKITGREMIRVFRPPYGAWNKTVIEAASDAGFPTVLLWDVDTRDWTRSATPSSVLRAALRGGRGSVILMHCGPSVTPAILDKLISGYQKRGFGFVTVPQLLSGQVPATAFAPPVPEPAPPAPMIDRDTPPMSLMTIVWMHRQTDWAI